MPMLNLLFFYVIIFTVDTGHCFGQEKPGEARELVTGRAREMDTGGARKVDMGGTKDRDTGGGHRNEHE